MTHSEVDHSVFNRHSAPGQCIYLVVYVDDIVITGNDQDGITDLKQHLFKHFRTKDLGRLKYFLGILITLQSSCGLELVPLPPGKSIISSRLVYDVKVGPG